MALCSGLAPLANNHFGRGALLRGRLRLPAINPAALISSVSHAADFRAGRALGHSMDGADAPRGDEYREPVSGTNGIYARRNC